MCDEGKEKRERSLDVSLLFFFERISRFGFVGSRQMKKQQFLNQTTLELYYISPKKKKKETMINIENGLSRNGIDNNDDAHTFYYSLYYYY